MTKENMIMEKKYMKPSIEVESIDIEQELMVGSIEAVISNETQSNEDALLRDIIGVNLPFEF